MNLIDIKNVIVAQQICCLWKIIIIKTWNCCFFASLLPMAKQNGSKIIGNDNTRHHSKTILPRNQPDRHQKLSFNSFHQYCKNATEETNTSIKACIECTILQKRRKSHFLFPYIADMRGKSPPWYTLIINMIIKNQ